MVTDGIVNTSQMITHIFPLHRVQVSKRALAWLRYCAAPYRSRTAITFRTRSHHCQVVLEML